MPGQQDRAGQPNKSNERAAINLSAHTFCCFSYNFHSASLTRNTPTSPLLIQPPHKHSSPSSPKQREIRHDTIDFTFCKTQFFRQLYLNLPTLPLSSELLKANQTLQRALQIHLPLHKQGLHTNIANQRILEQAILRNHCFPYTRE